MTLTAESVLASEQRWTLRERRRGHKREVSGEFVSCTFCAFIIKVARSSTQLRPQELFLFHLKQLRGFVFKVTLAPLLAEHTH